MYISEIKECMKKYLEDSIFHNCSQKSPNSKILSGDDQTLKKYPEMLCNLHLQKSFKIKKKQMYVLYPFHDDFVSQSRIKAITEKQISSKFPFPNILMKKHLALSKQFV